MTNYIKFKFFNKNNNKVQIKDVFFLNKTVNKPEMSDSLLFVFEKVIEVIGDRLCIGIESKKKKQKKTKKRRIICKSDYETWESVIEHWDSFKYLIADELIHSFLERMVH